MKTVVLLFAGAAALAAQSKPSSALIGTSQAIYSIAKTDVLKSMDKVPEPLWSFQPTKEVRTFAQMFAHIADGQYEFCGAAAEDKSASKDVEGKAKTRAEIMAAVKEAFAYCDAEFARLSDASAVATVPFFGGQKMTRIGIMDFNTAHTMEHYGNLVTYMRLKGIVPPSSEGQ